MILQNANAPAKHKPAPPAAAEAKRPAAPVRAEPAASAATPPEATAAAAPAAPSPAALPAPAPVQSAPPAIQPAPAPVAVAPVKAAPPPPVAKPRAELVVVSQEPPQLSTALLREQATGTVKVGFDVNPDGSTGGVKILSSTNRKLNAAAMNAVAAWKFKPIDEVRPTEVELVFSNQQ